MATIKDVAKAAGVSPTTVSLIINGKGKDGRISAETEARVYKVMKELNYTPNMSARRLRTDEPMRNSIAFYWPSDYRANVLSSFLSAFTAMKSTLDIPCDMVVVSYKYGELAKEAAPIRKNSYSGIIVGGASSEDLAFLEAVETRTPIVVMNRSSDRHSTVGTDNVEMGFLAARLIKQKGHLGAAVFTSQNPFAATGLRVRGFLDACAEIDLTVDSSWIFRTDASMTGGAEAAASYCRGKDMPKVIFCDADFIALGALHEFHKQNVRIPEDVEILAVQFLADDYVDYSIPSLTTLSMPNSKILESALRIINTHCDNPTLEPVHELIPASLAVRESF